MVKGKTGIELTNLKTGEKETYEKKNIVTNALRDIFAPIGLLNDPSFYFDTARPYYSTLLGGILLFDTGIEEDPDNYYPPAEASLTGCGVYGEQNNTSNTIRGSFNQTESEVNLTDRYVKYVYDFSTSQGNGNISSICLTHRNAGYCSYGGRDTTFLSAPLMISSYHSTLQYVTQSRTGAKTSSRYTTASIGDTEYIFLMDPGNDCAYYFRIPDSRHIHIVKRKLFLKSLSIFDDPYSAKPLVEEKELTELEKDLSTPLTYNYDRSNECLYICSAVYNLEPNGKLDILEIDTKTWGVKRYEVTNTSQKNLSSQNAFVSEGDIYLKGYSSPYGLYRFSLTDTVDAKEIELINAKEVSGTPKFSLNGRIWYEGGSQLLAVRKDNAITPESRSLLNNSSACNYTPVKGKPLLYYCDEGASSTSYGWVFLCNYLATINTLDAPVVKTADKTMKITYILEE